MFSWGGGSTTRTSVHYDTCKLKIVRRGQLSWDGFQFGSGFNVVLAYAKKLDLDGSVIGLTADLELNSLLAKFLQLNRELISSRIHDVEGALERYRQHHLDECRWKADVLTYRFLSHVFDHPQDPNRMTTSAVEREKDCRVRELMSGSEEVFSAASARFSAASSSETVTWWYIFWVSSLHLLESQVLLLINV